MPQLEPPIKILLVEDNPGDARLLRETLSWVVTTRFEIKNVSAIADALTQLEKQNFDVVLLDLSLPDSNGFKTFATMHAAAPQLPIIVLTGLDDEALGLDTVHAGAQDYLVKGKVE